MKKNKEKQYVREVEKMKKWKDILYVLKFVFGIISIASALVCVVEVILIVSFR